MTVPFETLAGKTIKHVNVDYQQNIVTFIITDGSRYELNTNNQFISTASVYIKQIYGNLLDLVNTPIKTAYSFNDYNQHIGEHFGKYWYFILQTTMGVVTICFHTLSSKTINMDVLLEEYKAKKSNIRHD